MYTPFEYILLEIKILDKLNYLWWIEAIVGVVTLVGLRYGAKKIIAYIQDKADTSDWRKHLDHIFLSPISVLVSILALAYVIDVAGQNFGFSVAISYLSSLRSSAIVICIAWVFFRWKKAFQRSLLAEKKKHVDIGVVQVVSRLSTIAALVLSAMILMQIFGINTAPLLAFGSIGAASIGFAGKDVMANFCSGMMLNITRPFVCGDLILLPEKNLEGFIEEIGWFRTSIRDREKRAVYLPNNFFSTMLVVNITRMTHRHIKQTFRVGFEHADKIAELMTKIKEATLRHSSIDAKIPVHVSVHAFGEYAFNIQIEAYSTETSEERFFVVQQEILLLVHKEMKKLGIEVPLPLMKLHSGSAFFELQELNKS